MSTIDFALVLNGLDRGVARSPDSPLRVVLVEGEALRLPRTCLRLRVLSGTAWVSQDGADVFVQAEGTFAPCGSDAAVVSPLGALPLLLEIR